MVESVGSGAAGAADPTLHLEGLTHVVAIASGGDSTIYRAHQPSLERDVAIKVVNLSDPDELRRFSREISLTVRLGRAHPNIVNVLDTRTLPDGRPCIVMDLFELGSTHDRLRATGPLSAEEVVTIGAVIGDALAFAHAQRVVHRDVKPQNILVLPTSYVLADFGIARSVDAGHTASLERLSYRHASPEVLDGQAPTPSDDLWSLCSTMATLLEGRAPFAADDPEQDTALAYLRRVRMAERRPLPESTPVALKRLIDRGMHPERASRYERAEDLIRDLRALQREFSGWAPQPVTAGASAPLSEPTQVPEPTQTPQPTQTPAQPPELLTPDGNRDANPTAPRAQVTSPPSAPLTSEEQLWAPGVSSPTANSPTSDPPPITTATAAASDPEATERAAQPLPPNSSGPASSPVPAHRSGRGEVTVTGPHTHTGGDVSVPAVSVAALVKPAGPGSDQDDDPADAAPTGLRPPEAPELAASNPTQTDEPKTTPKVRASILMLALGLLVASGVGAYFLTRSSGQGGSPVTTPTIGQVNQSQSDPPPSSRQTVMGADITDPDYLAQVLSVRFTNGLVSVTVRNPSAKDFQYILFDATDVDDRTKSGPLVNLTSEGFQKPSTEDNSVVTARFPADRCGQRVMLAVMAVSNDGARKAIAYSNRQMAPACA